MTLVLLLFSATFAAQSLRDLLHHVQNHKPVVSSRFHTLVSLSARSATTQLHLFHALPHSWAQNTGVGDLSSRRKNMKTQSSEDQPAGSRAARCLHRTPAGRRCRSEASSESVGLCKRHAASRERQIAGVLTAALAGDGRTFLSAKGINHSLMQLHTLLVKDMISPRRAAVLAYISSLLLRTLPAIEDESKVPGPGKRPLKIIFDLPHPPYEDEPPPSTSGS